MTWGKFHADPSATRGRNPPIAAGYKIQLGRGSEIRVRFRSMLSNVFLGISLVGAEWVLYLLILLSIVSVAVMFERARFYSSASRELTTFREQVRSAVAAGKWDEALKLAEQRAAHQTKNEGDLEAGVAAAILRHAQSGGARSSDVLSEAAQDAVMRTRLSWERNLAVLATIGNNAPFIGLFGTVLGIIKAFHDLSQAGAGAQTVSSGISEALIATAVGILVAIPAVAAFNLFQRRVKTALTEAEALKSYLVSKIAGSA